jgi:hypothetical protein
VNLSEKSRKSEPKRSLGVIPIVCEFFGRSESASAVILSEASLRAQSKDLARSSARQTEMIGRSTDDPSATGSILTHCRILPWITRGGPREVLRLRQPSLRMTPGGATTLNSLPQLSWGRAGVGVQAVLNLCENRLFPAQQKSARESAAEKNYPTLSRSTPTSFLPQDTGEEVRSARQRWFQLLLRSCMRKSARSPNSLPQLSRESASSLNSLPQLSRRSANTPNSLPQLSWGRAGVGVQAVLNLCENRLFPARQKSARESAAEKNYPAPSRSTPTSFLPQDTGEEVRNSACESWITSR